MVWLPPWHILFKKEGMMSMKRNWKQWLKAAGVRAVKTVAQTAVATIGASAVISEVDWIIVVSASLLAGVVSMLTSIAGLPEVPTETTEEEEKNA